MTAKEYLGQARKIEILIQNKIEYLQETRCHAASPSGVFYGERTGSSSPNKDKLLDAVAKIQELESIIAGEVERLTQLKYEIIHTIDQVDNADMMNLLYKRYILYKSWEEIAYDMNYAVQSIYRLHGKALQKISLILQD